MSKLIQGIRWCLEGGVAAGLYGIINDQITVTISPEYFSVFKHQQFLSALEVLHVQAAPLRVQASVVGALSTFWFGVILGCVMGAAGICGSRPVLPDKLYRKAVVAIMAFTLLMAALYGAIGWQIAPYFGVNSLPWPFLKGISDARAAFAVGVWHTGAYNAGVAGVLLGALWELARRKTLAPSTDVTADKTPPQSGTGIS